MRLAAWRASLPDDYSTVVGHYLSRQAFLGKIWESTVRASGWRTKPPDLAAYSDISLIDR
jgi:hypothetical protein